MQRLLIRTSLILFSTLLASCGQSAPSELATKGDRVEVFSARASTTQQCEVMADALDKARISYAQRCGGSPIDCDPIAGQWMCSNTVIGNAAPGIHIGSVSSGVCTASASTLDLAKGAYAIACSLPRRDCDPVGGDWVCSSAVIGASAPPLTTASAPIVAELEQASPFVQNFTLAAQWNELALAAIRAGSARPTATTWQMFVFSAAMYDAIAIYTPDSTPYALTKNHRRPSHEFTDANRRAAASQAAYHVLSRLFPEFEQEKGYFKRYLTSLGYRVTNVIDDSASSQGYQAAMAVFEDRANDGSNYTNDFEPITSLIYPEHYKPVNSPDPISNAGIFGDDFNPNAWQPLRVPNGIALNADELAVIDNLNINSFGDQDFLSPHWGGVTAFALSHGAELRPTEPPQLYSNEPYTDARGVKSSHDAAYRRQLEEVLYHSANLNDRLKVIAEFWADGPRTESPPGHWNQIAHGVIERDNLSLVESSQLFFALNGALLDAGIATWEAKRYYNYIRPASAIRWLYQDTQVLAWGGPNKGAQYILGKNWSPYQKITFVTPPFPEYVSGHSTFSRAAAEVLTKFSGSSTFYDGYTQTLQDVNSDGEPDMFGEHIARAGSFFIEDGPVEDVVLQWDTFVEAADEAGKSRLFGGIHIQDGDLRGRTLGRQVGERAFDHAMDYARGNI